MAGEIKQEQEILQLIDSQALNNNLRFHAFRLGIKLGKDFLQSIAMTGFGTCHIVKKQEKLEESIIKSMSKQSIEFNKIT